MITPLNRSRGRSYRGRPVNHSEIIVRRTADFPQQFEDAARRSGLNPSRIPGSRANRTSRGLSAIALVQRILLSSGSDGDKYRRTDGRS